MQNCNYFEKFIFDTKKFNILIVEDSSSMIKIIDNIFSNNGFNTFLSTSIKDAREKINSIEINYIILDINLPDGNGYELIKEWSSSKTKIIVLTSQTDSQLREISYQKGIIDFINKDKNFIYKISEIPNLIKQLEKNIAKTILIVEDSFVVREQLKDIYENRKYKVLTASNITIALDFINTNRIDLMLLDLELEKENGFEFLIKNKKTILDELKIKVVIVSGSISSTILRDAFRLGVRDIIKKPYVIEELILKTDMFINDKEIEDKMDCSKQLLEQYKNTVDRSSIVSKADTNGIITYVNDAFCEISGYKEDELLGKSHNIIKHPDTDSSIFKNMWQVIKEEKRTWTGIIKNKKKDGSDYWVQSIINPILDTDGNIIEYIGIRTDITQITQAKQYLKEQYNISQNNFQEIMNLSKLYESAMDESNIILRINTEGNITYLNEKFYKISGYTKEELIGQPYDNIKRIFPLNEDNNKIMKHLKSGKIWNGQVHNIFKDGKIHYFLATVIPIINLNGEILEYMSIRKEITEIIKLHEEIEDTQREIIYKMGEIGESRSNETGNHVKRVAEYSKLLALLSGLDEKECDILFTASPMHDIGKVGVPDSILNKPGKLDENEWKIMRKHTVIGFNILKNSKREILKAAAVVAMTHHEKWDGTGYPRNLKGQDIHIYGRITAIADVFDALGSHRCYKKAWEDEAIFKLLENEKGKHFDPKLIDLFFENIDKFKEIRDRYKD
ncbi:multi-sensor domain-containing two-component system response regulator c-di-GMP phosphodiesterase, RpfG family [Arcobacter venerupis]|uniref:Multi-sensor domain-containing two-component system response regulator c-di-GMP phosphodiesterase, RpfG family n=1 Tax=Arcobacter venerupis TaxID=1054033 RepID=A0AAE7BAE6_9BACT|nr:PAS domain S-box protein [Arcobacter venerupis]QKF66724.1 multi-sensor domain-containing two-component system response regulator c-di-GMP phosphodiesterase, RpfG family [Arcobacter venerupis]RWS48158.1 response regulator receiver protein [Arcobacter venerupis]